MSLQHLPMRAIRFNRFSLWIRSGSQSFILFCNIFLASLLLNYMRHVSWPQFFFFFFFLITNTKAKKQAKTTSEPIMNARSPNCLVFVIFVPLNFLIWTSQWGYLTVTKITGMEKKTSELFPQIQNVWFN